MKTFLLQYILLGICVLYISQRTAAQLIEYPSLTYKKMTFDQVHRGTYNNSECARDLINCWEIVKPDLVCGLKDQMFESVCGALRNHCSDIYGPTDVTYSGSPFPLFSMICEKKIVYTRRYITIPRNDTRVLEVLRALNYTEEPSWLHNII